MADLITIERARLALVNADTVDESMLATLVSAASRAIENWCHRHFAVATHQEKRSGGGSPALQLRQFPVVRLNRICVAKSAALEVRNSATASLTRAAVELDDSGLTLTRVAAGTSSVDTPLGGQTPATIAEMVSGINTLANGWQAQAVEPFGNWPFADLAPVPGALDCLGRWAALKIYNQELSDVELCASTGELRGWFPAGCQNVRLDSTAGFASIPEDVQHACAELVARWLDVSRRDRGLSGERLGDYQYWSAREGLPATVKALLSPYRAVR